MIPAERALLYAASFASLLAGCDGCGDEAPAAPATSTTGAPPRAFVTVDEDLVCASPGSAPVRCYGRRGTDARARREALRDPIHVALGADGRACVVTSAGVVRCSDGDRWRDVAAGEAIEVGLGAEHACALRRDGTVVCWGRNERGQLGDGATEPRAEPVPVAGVSDVEAIAVGAAHACALTRSGTVWCWGGFPRVDDIAASPDTPEELLAAAAQRPPPITRAEPVPGLGRALRIAAYGNASCAVTSGGRVACWPGYLGQGARAEPLPWPDDAARLAMGALGACVVRASGGAACWGHTAGDGRTRAVVPSAVRGIDGAVELAVGSDRACALRESGEVVCFRPDGELVALGSELDSR